MVHAATAAADAEQPQLGRSSAIASTCGVPCRPCTQRGGGLFCSRRLLPHGLTRGAALEEVLLGRVGHDLVLYPQRLLLGQLRVRRDELGLELLQPRELCLGGQVAHAVVVERLLRLLRRLIEALDASVYGLDTSYSAMGVTIETLQASVDGNATQFEVDALKGQLESLDLSTNFKDIVTFQTSVYSHRTTHADRVTP
jgi:hypothetical protein